MADHLLSVRSNMMNIFCHIANDYYKLADDPLLSANSNIPWWTFLLHRLIAQYLGTTFHFSTFHRPISWHHFSSDELRILSQNTTFFIFHFSQDLPWVVRWWRPLVLERCWPGAGLSASSIAPSSFYSGWSFSILSNQCFCHTMSFYSCCLMYIQRAL